MFIFLQEPWFTTFLCRIHQPNIGNYRLFFFFLQTEIHFLNSRICNTLICHVKRSGTNTKSQSKQTPSGVQYHLFMLSKIHYFWALKVSSAFDLFIDSRKKTILAQLESNNSKHSKKLWIWRAHSIWTIRISRPANRPIW